MTYQVCSCSPRGSDGGPDRDCPIHGEPKGTTTTTSATADQSPAYVAMSETKQRKGHEKWVSIDGKPCKVNTMRTDWKATAAALEAQVRDLTQQAKTWQGWKLLLEETQATNRTLEAQVRDLTAALARTETPGLVADLAGKLAAAERERDEQRENAEKAIELAQRHKAALGRAQTPQGGASITAGPDSYWQAYWGERFKSENEAALREATAGREAAERDAEAVEAELAEATAAREAAEAAAKLNYTIASQAEVDRADKAEAALAVAREALTEIAEERRFYTLEESQRIAAEALAALQDDSGTGQRR